MEDYLTQLNAYMDKIKAVKEIILTNIVLMGQTPCTPERDSRSGKSPRARVFFERLNDGHADECSVDSFGNPYAIVKGSSGAKPPIMLVAHMDTTYQNSGELLYSVTERSVEGPGLLDNSLGVGVLMSIPQLVKTLELSFQSDIYLIGLPESLYHGNLKSIRRVLKSWHRPVRAALCIEGGERGRLNYFSNSTIRAEVGCDVPKEIGLADKNGINAIVIVNEVINRILEIRLPQRPRTNIVLGRINSGTRYGKAPLYAQLGFEVHSQSDNIVEEVIDTVDEICGSVSHQTGVKIDLARLSTVKSARLTYHHPLVQCAMRVMDTLDIEPRFEPSQSELSVFLSHKIPAITLGIAHGENYQKEEERADIDSMFKGIAQVIGMLAAIDQGVCDD
jgi:acetylornithine deacetylase/succinyl-diaminopimelate desuccinylase-like protein